MFCNLGNLFSSTERSVLQFFVYKTLLASPEPALRVRIITSHKLLSEDRVFVDRGVTGDSQEVTSPIKRMGSGPIQLPLTWVRPLKLNRSREIEVQNS